MTIGRATTPKHAATSRKARNGTVSNRKRPDRQRQVRPDSENPKNQSITAHGSSDPES